MAWVYSYAQSGKNGTVVKSNMKKVYNEMRAAAGNAQIWHGTTAMDAFRLRRVNNYAGFCKSLELENFERAPFFWQTDAGAIITATCSRHRIE